MKKTEMAGAFILIRAVSKTAISTSLTTDLCTVSDCGFNHNQYRVFDHTFTYQYIRSLSQYLTG